MTEPVWAVDEALADEDHVSDRASRFSRLLIARMTPATDMTGVTEGLDDLMEGLGVEHGVGVDGHEQVGVTDFLKPWTCAALASLGVRCRSAA